MVEKIASENASEFFENDRLRWFRSGSEFGHIYYPRGKPEVSPGRADRLEIDDVPQFAVGELNSPRIRRRRIEFADRRIQKHTQES